MGLWFDNFRAGDVPAPRRSPFLAPRPLDGPPQRRDTLPKDTAADMAWLHGCVPGRLDRGSIERQWPSKRPETARGALNGSGLGHPSGLEPSAPVTSPAEFRNKS